MNHVLLTPKNKAQEIIDTNFIGTFLMSREAAKLMKTNCFGRIINITTVGTQMKLKGEAIYTTNFTAPTTRLEKTTNTVLLCCQSPGDVTQEATDKTIGKFCLEMYSSKSIDVISPEPILIKGIFIFFTKNFKLSKSNAVHAYFLPNLTLVQ